MAREVEWIFSANVSSCPTPVFCGLLWLGLSVAAQAKPDLVVAKLRLHGDQLVVQYQNQGAHGSAMPFDLRIGRWEKERMLEPTVVVRGLPVPDELGLLETPPIPLASLGLTDSERIQEVFCVRLDTANAVPEDNESNNQYLEHVFRPAQADDNTPDWDQFKGIPDLVVSSIKYYAPNSLVIAIENQGSGITAADFLVAVTVNGVSKTGNHIYRFRQPPPVAGQQMVYHDNSVNKFKVMPGDSAEVEVVVDFENRLRESNKANNRFVQKVTFGEAVPAGQPQGGIQGTITGSHGSLQIKSSFLTWLSESSTLRLFLFPYALDPRDLSYLAYGDAFPMTRRATVEGRPESDQPYAIIDFRYQGKPRQLGQPYVDADWQLTNWRTSTSVQSISGRTTGGRDGVTISGGLQRGNLVKVKIDQSIQDSQHEMKVKLQGELSLALAPQVATIHKAPRTSDQPLPIPPYRVSGSIRHGKQVMQVRGAFGLWFPESEELLVLLFPEPIAPQEIKDLTRNWLVDRKSTVAPGQIQSASLTFGKQRMGVNLVEVGGCGTYQIPDGMMTLQGKPGPGRKVQFRCQGTLPLSSGKQATFDVTGMVTAVKHQPP